MTRRTVRLVSSDVRVFREKGKTVIEDEAAGYRRVLSGHEVAKLLRDAADLNYLRSACEGKIPKRD